MSSNWLRSAIWPKLFPLLWRVQLFAVPFITGGAPARPLPSPFTAALVCGRIRLSSLKRAHAPNDLALIARMIYQARYTPNDLLSHDPLQGALKKHPCNIDAGTNPPANCKLPAALRLQSSQAAPTHHAPLQCWRFVPSTSRAHGGTEGGSPAAALSGP